MTARLERTTYGLGGSTVALHREGQLTPGGPYIEELYYMHGNHLGSMTLLTDEAGAVVDQARYYPFGEYRLEPTEGITDIGFTGHRQDNLGWENTGLIYMGARYYDPVLRRFISADTIVPSATDTLAYNRFAYVNQNPVNLVDPMGHCAGDPSGRYDHPDVDWDCWNYLLYEFCGGGLCADWREWIKVDSLNPWVREELEAIRAALLATKKIAKEAGVAMVNLLIKGLKFERADCGGDNACYIYPANIIKVENIIDQGPDLALFYIGHEIGHAVAASLKGTPRSLGNEYVLFHPRSDDLDLIWRDYWHRAGIDEMWADAFGAMVFEKDRGRNLTFTERENWLFNPLADESEGLFQTMYATVIDILQAYLSPLDWFQRAPR